MASASQPDLLTLVRSATSEAGSSIASSRRQSRGGRSESSLRSGLSTGTSRSSSRISNPVGMTLAEMQRQVNNAAMDRYINSLEKDAKDSVDAGHTWKRTVKGGHEQEKNEKLQRFELNKKNQMELRDQIELNKARRAETRKEYIENASAHAFPLFGETFISKEEVDAYYADQKKKFRDELDAQMTVSKTLRNIEEKKASDLTLAANSKNVIVMNRDRNAERARLAQQGQDMVASWERDIKLKAIKEAIHSGKDMTTTLKRGSP